MSEKRSNIAKTWEGRIDSGTFTKGQCLAWCQSVLPLSEEYPANGKRTNLQPHEARELRQHMDARANGVVLTDEHTAQGIEWLRRYGVKRGLPAWAVDEFEHFTFHGDGLFRDGGWRVHYSPIYRVHTRDGRMLDYVADPWQSGGSVWSREAKVVAS